METEEENANGERMLCPNCMTENLPVRDFCESCGCPIGPFVNVDPLKSIYSRGWLYRKAVSERVPGIAVWGMWLIFGSALLAVLIQAVAEGWDLFLGEPLWLHFLYAPVLFVYIMLLYRVTKNYVAFRRTGSASVEDDHTSEADANR